ncbi:MAG: RNA polymerase sigma factor [Isosphaeraceae bacterium]|nr:RNA polymerase sigma factor [Isosphaeraceae bacterium]
MAESQDHLRLSPSETTSTGRATSELSRVEELFHLHSAEIRRFVLGVVRDPELASDVLQTTFTKAVQQGHTARSETLKGWLFRVAYHEAITARRRLQTREQAQRKLQLLWAAGGERPEDPLIRRETVEAVRKALDELPANQRRVVWARLYEDKTFAAIAAEIGVPLGTVLTRMRLALEKLRRSLQAGE